MRGAAAGARPGHAARGHLQREGGEARHQGARAHQAAPQGENLMNTFKNILSLHLKLWKSTGDSRENKLAHFSVQLRGQAAGAARQLSEAAAGELHDQDGDPRPRLHEEPGAGEL